MELRYQMNDIIPLLSIPQPPIGRSSYNIPCPLCDHPNTRHGHLNINLKKNVFRCSKCGSFEGGVFDLYAYYMNIPVKDVYATLQGEVTGADIEQAPAKQGEAIATAGRDTTGGGG